MNRFQITTQDTAIKQISIIYYHWNQLVNETAFLETQFSTTSFPYPSQMPTVMQTFQVSFYLCVAGGGVGLIATIVAIVWLAWPLICKKERVLTPKTNRILGRTVSILLIIYLLATLTSILQIIRLPEAFRYSFVHHTMLS
eukprot:TRINITY_DN3474_c0_g1_i2.p1 TRINITY_DN3474_c0_g1~~TRINITY_DN3474_c0_g1_i2.p1  ORF type:complete len:141 (-),score=13.12 TRINITY_DN3474_c0_g1_i2:440-862(-)